MSIPGWDSYGRIETFTEVSFEEVAAGAGGYTARGWRYATEGEVCRFMHQNVLPEWVPETGCAPISTGDFSEEARARQVERDVLSPASPPGDHLGSFLVRDAPQAVPGLSAGGRAAAAVVMLAAALRRLRRT